MTTKIAITEKALQASIVDLLNMFHYQFCHTYPLQTKHGVWRTPATSPGFPDLVALRGSHIIAIEVKSATGRVTKAQTDWLSRFHLLDSGKAWLISPTDNLTDVARWLARPEEAPKRTAGK